MSILGLRAPTNPNFRQGSNRQEGSGRTLFTLFPQLCWPKCQHSNVQARDKCILVFLAIYILWARIGKAALIPSEDQIVDDFPAHFLAFCSNPGFGAPSAAGLLFSRAAPMGFKYIKCCLLFPWNPQKRRYSSLPTSQRLE